MAMNPKAQDTLARYVMVAKAVIYNTERMKQFLQLMESPQGAVSAVMSVMQFIEQKRPVPPDIAPFLAVNCYMLMVDMAQQSTGRQADGEVMKKVITKLLQSMQGMHATAKSAPPEPAPPRGGLIQSAGVPA